MQQMLDLVTAQIDWLVARVTQLANDHNYQNYAAARHMNWRTFANRLLMELSAAPSAAEWLTNFCTSAANRHRALGADFVVIHGLVKIMRQSLHELIDRAALCDIDAVRNHQDIDQGFNYLETVLSKAWFDSREDEKVVELEQTVQDLVGERALYEAIYVHASEPIFVLDPSGTIQSLNPAAAKLLTVTRAEAIGRPVSDVVPWLASAVDQPPNGDRFVEVEVATPNGVRCYQIKQALLPAILAGRAAQLVISLTDITPLRQQAAQMKKTAEELTFLNDFALELADAAIETGICWLVAKRLRALTRAAFCAVSHLRVRDNRWGVYAVDGAPDDLRRIEQVLGRSPLGMTYQISRFALDQLSAYPLLPIRSLEEMSQGFLTSEDAKGIRAALDVGDCYGLAFLYRGQPVGTAVFVMPKQRPLDKSKISVLQPFSHLAAIALQRAISERERRRAEAALAKSETRYRQLFETSCDGIVMLDAHGRFNDCNRAYLGLLGYESVDEIRGKSIFDLTPSEYHPLDLRVLREDLPVRGYSDEYEKEYYRKDGSRIPVVVRAWLTPGESGPRAIVRDLSPLRMMEENSSAMEKYRILGELAAAISHEVRNPLTTVRGFLQHFSSKPIYSDDDKEFFELMIKELDSATTIISDFLDTARPSRLKLQEFDLAAVVASLCRVMESRALLQKVDMATDTAGPMMVCGDAGQIRQVLINLLQNALQAMPAGGSLTVRCSVEDSMARVEIADTGVGIPFENLEKIGRPFFTTKLGGSGLGLSTCYRIIGTHRGRIAVESEIGKGTTFTCYLPLA